MMGQWIAVGCIGVVLALGTVLYCICRAASDYDDQQDLLLGKEGEEE